MFLQRALRENRKGRWRDVFQSLALVSVIYLGVRWLTIEPYVIPSGSMKPTLLIQDYVAVNKWTYGLRLPFSKRWLLGPYTPRRGDVVVFRSVDDPGHFMVKRVIGLPGETVALDSKGLLSIDGVPLRYQEIEVTEDDVGNHLQSWEALKAVGREGPVSRQREHIVQYSTYETDRVPFSQKVPEGQIFVMGDNRDHSMDSRFWGTLPLRHLLGRASLIWMSCEDNDKVSSFLCAPEFFRRSRIFSRIH